MKTTARYLSKKRFLLKTILTSKVKSTIDRYKKCRFWLTKGLLRVANNWKETVPSTRGKTAPRGIDGMFIGLDENRDLLVKHLNAGQDLYPNCDTSIWLRNCTHEIPTPIQGKIEGKIPEWLSGSLLRNGPGSTRVGNYEFKHVFDSSALLHRYAFKNGTVSYQCRFLESNTYKQNKAAQRIVITEFGTRACPDPCKTIFHRFSNVFKWGDDQSDNAMISIYPIGDEYFTFTEYPIVSKIDPTTLETLKTIDIARRTGIVHHTAHPHVAADGAVFNLATIPKIDGPHYCVVKFPRVDSETGYQYSTDEMFGRVCIVATIKCRWPLHPGYMHSFGITEHYFVVVEQPLSISLSTVVVNRFKGDPLSSALKWFQDCPTLIHLISRSDGRTVKTFKSDAFFYLHIINQYEEDDHVVIDICCYRDPSMIDCMFVEALQNLNKNPDYAAMFRSRPLRFVLPVNSDKPKSENVKNDHLYVSPEKLCDLGCETPRINEFKIGIKYRFFYAISSDVDSENPGTLIKVDTYNKTYKTWCEQNVYPSEPIFVSFPDAEGEDDGVVLSSIIWGSKCENQAGVIVLDAKSWTEIGRAVFVTQSPVPKCLHGWYAAAV
ncbi:PREDICTED: carotenoid isomerooxygenase isoform X1 [Diuraphis noxia]|uniref:carotenoid isomerooxygenase isoform X1 n=2 Tax=Diuraphis noxia TaxID=143948 RepID=UPI00076395E5|nr:PREDICTED: carotenoid isomerooxygenase isoform X1 [Diuraphis noxia]